MTFSQLRFQSWQFSELNWTGEFAGLRGNWVSKFAFKSFGVDDC